MPQPPPNPPTKSLHILVDSREHSISAAQGFYREHLGEYAEGKVVLTRSIHFAKSLQELVENAQAGDHILIAMYYIPPDQLHDFDQDKKWPKKWRSHLKKLQTS